MKGTRSLVLGGSVALAPSAAPATLSAPRGISPSPSVPRRLRRFFSGIFGVRALNLKGRLP